MRVIVVYVFISLVFCVRSAHAQSIYVKSFRNTTIYNGGFREPGLTRNIISVVSRSDRDIYGRMTHSGGKFDSKSNLLNAAPPVAVNDTARTETNTPITFSVVANDSDPDGKATLDLTSLDIDPAVGTQKTFTVAAEGTYVANNNGTVTFTPVASYKTGKITSTAISYTIKDNTGLTSNSATISMMVNPKTAPVANPDETTTPEDSNITFSLVANDTDLNGNNTIDVASVDLDPGTGGRQTSFTVTGQGSFTVTNAGILTFVPVPNYFSPPGTATTITYTVADTDDLRSTAGTITLTISAVADTPVAVSDAVTANEDLPITFSLTANDTDADGNNTIDPASIDLDTGPGVLTVLTVPIEGTYTAGTNGTVTFAPFANYNSRTGTATPIRYTIKDNTGLTSNAAQITVTVNAVNDLPTVSNVTKSGTQAQTIVFTSGDFTSKFSDIEGSPLSKIKVLSIPIFGILKLYGVPVTIGKEILVDDIAGINFEPISGWYGTTSFLWTGHDDAGYAAQNATVVITVIQVNQPPVVSAIVKSIKDNETVAFATLDFTERFSDPENSVLAKIQIVSLPSGGTLKLSGTNIIAGQEIPFAEISKITYAPDAGRLGVYAFNWNGSDGTSYAQATSTVTITVISSNRPPVLSEIIKSGMSPTPISFSIADFTSQYSDPENNGMVRVKVISLPANGTLLLNGVNVIAGQEINIADLPKLSFRPAPNWDGTTSFVWNAFDGNLYAVNNARVSIIILRPSDPNAKIGAAKKLFLVKDGINETYDVKFVFTVVNYGPNGLRNLSLQDNLSQALEGTEFTIRNISASGTLKANPSFNGNTNTELLLPSSTLAGGAQAQVELDLNVRLVSRAGLFYNYAFVEGASVITGDEVQDKSTDGLKPDPAGNGDVSLSILTPIELAPRPTFIPGGFTPNNDGINDYLVIENTLGQKIAIEVFNRWGNRVYRSSDYKNDWGGKCTEGILMGQDIPDGTYFYVLLVDNKNRFVGSLTVQR